MDAQDLEHQALEYEEPGERDHERGDPDERHDHTLGAAQQDPGYHDHNDGDGDGHAFIGDEDRE